MGLAINEQVPQNRLRTGGIKLSKSARDAKIIELLERGPMTPSQLGIALGYSRVHVSTNLLKPMLESNQVEKIPATDLYQIKGHGITKNDVESKTLTESTFYNDCHTIKKWPENTSSQNTVGEIAMFARICLGIRVKEFKINPDNWNHPEDTITIVKLLQKQAKVDLLPNTTRQVIRHFVMYGLEKTISQEEGIKLGLSGEKMQPKNATLEMSKEQYDTTKQLLKKNTQKFVEFGFKYFTFCRPSIFYTIKTDQITFYDRQIEYIEVNNKKIYKKEIIEFYDSIIIANPDLKKTVKKLKMTQRAARLNLFEFKTGNTFPKFIYDEEIVKALEKYVAKRKFQKKKYIFWDDNNIEFNKLNYRTITDTQLNHDNKFFTAIFKKIGFKEGDFGSYWRANYAIRHFGLQFWLQMTDYDFGFVAEMSHKDLATLTNWYGKRSMTHLEKKISEVVF